MTILTKTHLAVAIVMATMSMKLYPVHVQTLDVQEQTEMMHVSSQSTDASALTLVMLDVDIFKINE